MQNYLTDSDKSRIQGYELYSKIYDGDHYDAFNVISQDFKKDYATLRYIACNFAGLMSRVCADMLFEEFPSIQLPQGDNVFITELLQQNHVKSQIYESGLEQSYNGDVVFRVRSEAGQILIEDINPAYYFPEYNINNVRAEPTAHCLQWEIVIDVGGTPTKCLFKERHLKGKIEYYLWQLNEDGSLGGALSVAEYLKDPNGNAFPESVDTGIDDFLIVYIPNKRTNRRFYGTSDYKDLIPLFFGINNRITKIDSILEKHGEPILQVPEGVLDDEGKVRRESFGVIEVNTQESGGGKMEYIVWDAKLDSAFKEIENMVSTLMMLSDMSPALFGEDKSGQAESGRALKFKLLRVMAKKHAKELYYDVGLKDLFFIAQKFAKANNLKAGTVGLTKAPVKPVITWKDGVINDNVEQSDIEDKRLANGTQSEVDAIMNMDGLSEDEAKAKWDKIQKENKDKAPAFGATPAIFGTGKDMGNQNMDNNNNNNAK